MPGTKGPLTINFDQEYLFNKLVKLSKMSATTSIIRNTINLASKFIYLRKYLLKTPDIKWKKSTSSVIYLRTETVHFINSMNEPHVYAA